MESWPNRAGAGSAVSRSVHRLDRFARSPINVRIADGAPVGGDAEGDLTGTVISIGYVQPSMPPPVAGRLPVPPGSKPARVAAPSQAGARKNLSSAAHKLAECPEMRNFSKVVRTTRQVCEPNRPCEPLGYIGHSGMRTTRLHRPLCHTHRPTMGAARP